MQIKTIIHLRNFFIILASIIIFFGSQVVPATKTNEKASILEAFGMVALLAIPQYAMWSEYVYNTILDEGVLLNYKFYQSIGLLVAIGIFILMINVYAPSLEP